MQDYQPPKAEEPGQESPEAAGMDRRQAFKDLGLLVMGASAVMTGGCDWTTEGKQHIYSGNMNGLKVDYFTFDPRGGRWSIPWGKREASVLKISDKNGDPMVEYWDADGTGSLGDHENDKVIIYGPKGTEIYSKERFVDVRGNEYNADAEDPVVKQVMSKAGQVLKNHNANFRRYVKKIQKDVVKS